LDDVLEAARAYSDGEEVDEMGYPDWYWQWSNWYLTTERDPTKRPGSAPKEIPQWAWDANEQQLKLLNRYGMTADERAWLDWYLAGKTGNRPDIPQTIPDRWWDDQKWAARR